MKKGFSVVELVVYTAVFALLLGAIVGTALALSRSYRGVADTAAVERAAVAVLERLSRVAREGESVVSAGNALVLDTESGTVEFLVHNGALRLKENGVDRGALTGNKVSVSNFTAHKIETGQSEAVKVVMTLGGKNFYTTIVLRNSY